MSDLKVSISPGNSKMGTIPSVSLPPVETCPHDAPCFHDCYARRLCAMRPTMKTAYETNLQIWNTDPAAYLEAVDNAIKMTRYFRFHVGGDIPDRRYAAMIWTLAKHHPQTEILCFTKQYEICNETVRKCGLPPRNLHLIFSAWPGKEIENEFDFPVCQVLFKGQTPDPSWKLCTGNCTQCALTDCGCWTLQKGETIAIPKH